MTHLYYGDPNKEFSDKLAETLLKGDADILEIGIPYTDPVCDGEIFQRACKRAISGGLTPFMVFDGVRKLKERGFQQPIYLTSYYGPIFKIGVEKFVSHAKKAGVRGLIVPDLLLEEQGELKTACDSCGLSLIQFATVYSSRERLAKIVKYSGDFIYCISLPGVTGDDLLPLYYNSSYTEVVVGRLTESLKKITNKKIMVGFGIREKADAQKILRLGADGLIVGSAIARIYEENINHPEKSLPKIASFIKDLKDSTIKRNL